MEPAADCRGNSSAPTSSLPSSSSWAEMSFQTRLTMLRRPIFGRASKSPSPSSMTTFSGTQGGMRNLNDVAPGHAEMVAAHEVPIPPLEILAEEAQIPQDVAPGHAEMVAAHEVPIPPLEILPEEAQIPQDVAPAHLLPVPIPPIEDPPEEVQIALAEIQLPAADDAPAGLEPNSPAHSVDSFVSVMIDFPEDEEDPPTDPSGGPGGGGPGGGGPGGPGGPSGSHSGGPAPPPLPPRLPLPTVCCSILKSIIAILPLLAYICIGGTVHYVCREDFSHVNVTSFHVNSTLHRLVESVYFSVVTVSTVGFGDIYPSTHHLRTLVAPFVIIGAVLLAAVIFTVQTYVGDAHERSTWSLTTPAKVAVAISLVALWIGFGTVMIHNLEGLDWVNSSYMAVISAMTVGYGDLTFLTFHGRIFGIFWMSTALLVIAIPIGYLGGAAVAAWVLRERWRRDKEDHILVRERRVTFRRLRHLRLLSDSEYLRALEVLG